MKLLLVEDEDIMREGLTKMVERMDIPGLTVSSASNGEEAWERLENGHFDIVLTDICMPKLDGLELIRRISERAPEIQSIILSGYDEFAYAQQAVHLGCREYLLKPPSFQELQQLLREAAGKISAEREKRLDEQRSKSLALLSRHSLQRELMSGLLRERVPIEAAAARAKARDLGFSLDADRYRLLLLGFDELEESKAAMSEQSWGLMKYAAANIAQEISGVPVCFYHDGERLAIVMPADEDDGEQAALRLCESVRNHVRQYLKLTMSAAVSSVTDLSLLPNAYLECAQTMKYRFAYGKEMLHGYESTQRMQSNPAVATVLNELRRIGSLGAVPALIAELQECCRSMEAMEMTPAQLEALSGEWKLLLLSLIGRWAENEQLPETFAKHRLIETVDREEGAYKMMAPVIRLLQEIENLGNRRRIENRGIEQAKQYIDEHYSEPMTLQKLSDLSYMNPAYFSVLFKKQIGKSMTQYLTEKRLEKARELLRLPDRKTYQIAEEVGFENAAYFSTLFKKYTGFTPQEYRSIAE